jgi:hypothetical protein
MVAAEPRQPQPSSSADALIGLVSHWGSRYGKRDAEVAKATDELVTALGGTLEQPGM